MGIFLTVLPLAVGGAAALLTMDAMAQYSALPQPPLAPPGWVFPVAWTVLFLLMGIASYLVAVSAAPQRTRQGALYLYALQLAVNFFWSPIFFGTGAYLFAFIWLLLLWLLIVLTVRRFAQIRSAAGWLLMPYLAWVTFAGYLNFGIFLLN